MPDFPDFDPAIAEAVRNRRDETGMGGFLGITTLEVGPGTMRCGLDVRPELMNPFGVMHGGVVSALVDHILGAVCYPVVPQGTWVATTEFKLNLVAPVREGTVEASAEIVAMSRSSGVVRIEVTNGGRVVAVAQGTVTLKAPRA